MSRRFIDSVHPPTLLTYVTNSVFCLWQLLGFKYMVQDEASNYKSNFNPNQLRWGWVVGIFHLWGNVDMWHIQTKFGKASHPHLHTTFDKPHPHPPLTFLWAGGMAQHDVCVGSWMTHRDMCVWAICYRYVLYVRADERAHLVSCVKIGGRADLVTCGKVGGRAHLVTCVWQMEGSFGTVCNQLLSRYVCIQGGWMGKI